MAYTFGPGGDPANLSEIPHYPFPPDRGLDDHMSRALKADLPGMFPSAASTTMPGTREVVGAIKNLTEEYHATQEEASTRREDSSHLLWHSFLDLFDLIQEMRAWKLFHSVILPAHL